MSKIKLLLLISFSIFCFCSKKEQKPSHKYEEKSTYKYFEYSFESSHYINPDHINFSIQIKPNDSIYLRDRKYYEQTENGIRLNEIETYYLAIITKSQRKELNSLISKIPFKEYDTIYPQDCYSTHYVTYIEKKSIKKLVFVSNFDRSPDQLDSLSKWLNELKTNSKWIKTNKKIDFITTKYVTIPPPPPMPVKK
ncbi:MAG: hypothetical protein B7Y83_15665 [Flavobacteriales bacterium 32-34-25]|nr:MAG: hypothetical protein B7Y83_15665 [Flavobacteriales bacterium 32-34-25]